MNHWKTTTAGIPGHRMFWPGYMGKLLVMPSKVTA